MKKYEFKNGKCFERIFRAWRIVNGVKQYPKGKAFSWLVEVSNCNCK